MREVKSNPLLCPKRANLKTSFALKNICSPKAKPVKQGSWYLDRPGQLIALIPTSQQAMEFGLINGHEILLITSFQHIHSILWRPPNFLSEVA